MFSSLAYSIYKYFIRQPPNPPGKMFTYLLVSSQQLTSRQKVLEEKSCGFNAREFFQSFVNKKRNQQKHVNDKASTDFSYYLSSLQGFSTNEEKELRKILNDPSLERKSFIKTIKKSSPDELEKVIKTIKKENIALSLKVHACSQDILDLDELSSTERFIDIFSKLTLPQIAVIATGGTRIQFVIDSYNAMRKDDKYDVSIDALAPLEAGVAVMAFSNKIEDYSRCGSHYDELVVLANTQSLFSNKMDPEDREELWVKVCTP